MLPRLLRRLLHLAAWLQTIVSITVATAGIDPATIRFRHRSVKDGLSQSTINCVIQDHEGFIWLGTQDGLNRYDGYTFNVYRHDSRDSLSISDSYVNSLFEDSKGRLWIGTYSGGLNLYDRDRDAFTHFLCDTTAPSTISGSNVWGITEEKGGKIWVAVWAGGVNGSWSTRAVPA